MGQGSTDVAAQASSRLVAGIISFEWGQLTTALKMLEEAILLAEQVRHLPCQIGSRAHLGWLYGLLGDNDYGLVLGQAALAQAEASQPVLRAWPLAVLVRLCIRQGRLHDAEAALQYRYVDLMADATTTLEPALTALAAGELALARQDHMQALAIIDDLTAYLQTSGSTAFRVEAALLKSQALLGLSQEVAAYDTLLQARATAETQQARFWLWPLLMTLGSLARQRGDVVEAGHCCQQAQRILEAITHTIENPLLRESFLAAPPMPMIRHSECLQQALQRHRRTRPAS
jgi:tetratricopeptide (TPR) repeat protein